MSSIIKASVLFATALSVGSAAGVAEVLCPPTSHGHSLERMSLFIGNPRDLIELAPAATPTTAGGFTYQWPLKSSAGLVAVCRYATNVDLEIPLPPGLNQCRVDHTTAHTTALCW